MHKPDANHGEIRDNLRKIPGCVVFDAAHVGGGFPDLVVGFQGVITLLEIKDGGKPPSRRRLTEVEAKFHRAWLHLPVFVVNNYDEALEAIGIDPFAVAPF